MSTSAATVIVTHETSAEVVLGLPVPVLVGTWATSCGPCQQIAPVLEALACDCAGQLVIAKLNADANPRTVADAGVVSIPTLNVCSGGQLVTSVVGPRPTNVLVDEIEEVLA